jgi:hypothetical protein
MPEPTTMPYNFVPGAAALPDNCVSNMPYLPDMPTVPRICT